MRWLWIDKFIAFESGSRAVAVKNCSLAEDHVHDLYPAFPLVPHSLLIEGMAQTAGILVGEARGFREKVILAKIGKAIFTRLVRPGETVEFHATIQTINETGASIEGVVRVRTTAGLQDVAGIELMFSHIDQNLAGTKFPKHNFVFTEQFKELLGTYRLEAEVAI